MPDVPATICHVLLCLFQCCHPLCKIKNYVGIVSCQSCKCLSQRVQFCKIEDEVSCTPAAHSSTGSSFFHADVQVMVVKPGQGICRSWWNFCGSIFLVFFETKRSNQTTVRFWAFSCWIVHCICSIGNPDL